MNLTPGKAIGIIAAQSITSSMTQTVLNQFHSCGANIQAITTGVPRLIELLNLKQKYDKCVIVAGRESCVGLVDCTFDQLIVRYDWVTTPPPWVALYVPSAAANAGFLFELDKDKIVKLHIPFSKFSIVPGAIVSPHFDLFIPGDPEMEKQIIENAFPLRIHGYPGIVDAAPREAGLINLIVTGDTRTCLFQLLEDPQIDATRTWSTNVWDIYAVLGIEAAYNFLIKELREVLDPGLDPLHTQLLVNQMTWPGTLQSVTRYSLRDDIVSVFTKASFEESMLNFINAVYTGETDNLTEVSSSIVVGQRTHVGTGFFDVCVPQK